MSTSPYIATFVVRTRVNLASDQLTVAKQALNGYFTGKKYAPHYYDSNAEGTDEHKEAHCNVAMTHDVGLTVGLLPDGSLHVIGVFGA